MPKFRTSGRGKNRKVYPINSRKSKNYSYRTDQHQQKKVYKYSDDERFKPTKSDNGYSELKQIGFYCYKSDRDGDWHRNNQFPGLKVLGTYQGYEIYKDSKSMRGWILVSNPNKRIKKGDTENLKKQIIKASKGEKLYTPKKGLSRAEKIRILEDNYGCSHSEAIAELKDMGEY